MDEQPSLPENREVIATLLRRATAEDHQATEAAFPLLDAGLTLASYRRLLSQMYGLVAGWEALLQLEAPALLRPLVASRLRGALLAQDLADIGAAPAALWQPGTSERPSSTAAWFGAMYVMEGSRLGGLYIARAVEQQLGLQDGKGLSYFQGFGRETKPHWQEFLMHLEQAVSLRQSAAAVFGAKRMFHTFGSWMAAGVPSQVPAPPEE